MTVKVEPLAGQQTAEHTAWAWRSEGVILLYAAGLVLFYNQAFWSFLLRVTSLSGWHGLVFQAAVFSLLTAFFFLVLSLLPFRWLGRPLLSLLLPLSALAAYFMNQYGTAIDGRMMQNVFETDLREMLDLATLKVALYFLLLGVLPVVLLWCIPLQSPQGLQSALQRRVLAIVAAVLVLLLAAGSQYQSIASVARNHKEIRYYLVPNNFIKGIQDYLKDLGGLKHTAGEMPAPAPIARDAHPGASWTGRTRKTLFVLVVGETARAENFGLDGYERNTTPELAQQQGLVNFSHMTSCGTDTAVSLPCMMSGMGRDDYSLARAREHENLLDVVQRSGIKVLWVDNQSGCKRVCDRVQRINTSEMTDPAFCKDGECQDGILIEQLRHYADNMTQDTLVVLHQMGSHGPAYYKRYPAEFEHFKPACGNAQLDKCSREEIRNAYDNSILYTDHVLSGLINTLRDDASRHDTALLYLSDHGESLGELGLYLHGAPYLLAPSVQKHVPAVLWLSPQLEQARKLESGCLARQGQRELSHDNLFHSVLGLLDVQTKMHQLALDLFAPCLKT